MLHQQKNSQGFQVLHLTISSTLSYSKMTHISNAKAQKDETDWCYFQRFSPRCTPTWTSNPARSSRRLPPPSSASSQRHHNLSGQSTWRGARPPPPPPPSSSSSPPPSSPSSSSCEWCSKAGQKGCDHKWHARVITRRCKLRTRVFFLWSHPLPIQQKKQLWKGTIKMARVLLKKCFSPLITTIYRESCASMSNKSIKRQKVKVKHAQTPQMHWSAVAVRAPKIRALKIRVPEVRAPLSRCSGSGFSHPRSLSRCSRSSLAMTGSQGKKKETPIPFSPFTRTVARALIHSPMWHLGTRVEEEGGEIGVGGSNNWNQRARKPEERGQEHRPANCCLFFCTDPTSSLSTIV